MAYTKHEDPGHGWLEVPKRELIELGIADQISDYSYQDKDNVYLEEDCDMTIFLKAKGVKKWSDIDIVDAHLNGDHWVRGLKPYKGGIE